MKGTARKINSQKRRFLNFLRPLMSAGLPFMKNARALLAKSVLILLILPATTRATDTVIQHKIFANEEMDNIMKIVKSLEESGLLMKCVNETIKNESKAKG